MKKRLSVLAMLVTLSPNPAALADDGGLTGAWRSPPTSDGWGYAMVLRVGGACDLQALHAMQEAGVDKTVMIDWKCMYVATDSTIDFTFVAYSEAGQSKRSPSFNYTRVLPPAQAAPAPPAHVRYRLAQAPNGDPLLITLKADGSDKTAMTRGAELSQPI